MQLVQTSAHDVRMQAKRLAKKRRELAAQASYANISDEKSLLDDTDRDVSSSLLKCFFQVFMQHPTRKFDFIRLVWILLLKLLRLLCFS